MQNNALTNHLIIRWWFIHSFEKIENGRFNLPIGKNNATRCKRSSRPTFRHWSWGSPRRANERNWGGRPALQTRRRSNPRPSWHPGCTGTLRGGTCPKRRTDIRTTKRVRGPIGSWAGRGKKYDWLLNKLIHLVFWQLNNTNDCYDEYYNKL